MFKLASTLTLLAGLAFAQAGLTLICPTTAAVGSLTCTIALNTISATPVALQFTVNPPPQATSFTATISPALAAAGKLLNCGNNICILYSTTNDTVLSAGTIATIVFQIPKNAIGANLPNCPNCISVGINSSIAADASANLVPSTVNPSLSVSIPSACDVNGDGLVNAVDIAAILPQIQKTSPAMADLNSDGVVTVQDEQIIRIAIATGVCNAK